MFGVIQLAFYPKKVHTHVTRTLQDISLDKSSNQWDYRTTPLCLMIGYFRESMSVKPFKNKMMEDKFFRSSILYKLWMLHLT